MHHHNPAIRSRCLVGKPWRCISGYGHAPEHIALYQADAGVLISGDMVLPRISTNVSVYDAEPEADNLRLFLESIDKFKLLPAGTLTLPSHGKPFVGLHERIAQLHAHHRDRLGEVMQACAEKACCAHDVLPVLFKRPLDLHQTTFAMGEAIAHIHALWHAGQLQRQGGADGLEAALQGLPQGQEQRLAFAICAGFERIRQAMPRIF